MSLPLSRNTTYTVAAQVKSVDLNALQDMVIGGRHGLLSMIIPGSAFHGWNGSNAIGGFATGIGTFLDSASSEAWAPIPLPVGTVIREMTWWYIPVSGGSGQLTPSLKRRDLASGTVTTTATGVLDTTGSAVESQTVTGINHTMLDATSYWVHFDMGAIGGEVHGARIVYDK